MERAIANDGGRVEGRADRRAAKKILQPFTDPHG
jgi:hypothetical protein